MRLRALLCGLAVLTVTACDGSTAPPVGEYESLPSSSVMTDVQLRITSDGVRRALLRADTSYMYEDSSVTHLKVVHLEMFDNAGQLTSTLTSETGDYNQQTEKTVARGNVVLIMPGEDGGRTIYTEELHYDPRAKRIWSDVPTRMIEGGRELRGRGFTSDDQFINVTIQGGAGTGLPMPIESQ